MKAIIVVFDDDEAADAYDAELSTSQYLVVGYDEAVRFSYHLSIDAELLAEAERREDGS